MGSCGIIGSAPAKASSCDSLEVGLAGVGTRFGFLLTPRWLGCQAYSFRAHRGLVGQFMGLILVGLFTSYLAPCTFLLLWPSGWGGYRVAACLRALAGSCL